MELQLNGLVVKPDEVLVIVLPERAETVVEEVITALDAVGLTGRTLVLTGDNIQLATVPDE